MKRFKKHNNKQNVSAEKNVKIIDSHIREIASILNLRGNQFPDIQPVESDQYIRRLRNGKVEFLAGYSGKKVPNDEQILGGFCPDDENAIYLSNFSVKYTFQKDGTLKGKLVKMTAPESLFLMAHELRHVWQKFNNKGKYYETNASNAAEEVTDIAEIDADAFALAYIFSVKTSFSRRDFPSHFMLGIDTLMMQDRGKRLKRAYELAREYKFAHFHIC